MSSSRSWWLANMMLVGAAALLTTSCSKKAADSGSPAATAPISSTAPPKDDTMKPMTPKKPSTFADGHALTPPAALGEWLDKHAANNESATFRIPVVIVFQNALRMSIERAFIGTAVDSDGSGALAVDFDDTAMGIGLFDQLNNKLDDSTDRCAVWIEGHWGPMLRDTDDQPPGSNPDAHVITVRAVGDLIAAPDDSAQVQLAR